MNTDDLTEHSARHYPHHATSDLAALAGKDQP